MPRSVRLCATPLTVACQAPLSMGFFSQEYWNGLPFSPPGNLPNPGIEPATLRSPALAGGFFTTSTTWEALRNEIMEVNTTGAWHQAGPQWSKAALENFYKTLREEASFLMSWFPWEWGGRWRGMIELGPPSCCQGAGQPEAWGPPGGAAPCSQLSLSLELSILFCNPLRKRHF